MNSGSTKTAFGKCSEKRLRLFRLLRAAMENQAKRASDAELAQMLREMEAMTEEEAQKQLAGERALPSRGDTHE